MVNSINNGSTMVEVEFSIGSVQYKVIRGIKPNKFEIYQNDKLLNLGSQCQRLSKDTRTTNTQVELWFIYTGCDIG